jgi:8-oxo-dGTP pyrophosphatase MutT (NUDIX family)
LAKVLLHAGVHLHPAFWQPRRFVFFDHACRSDETNIRLNDEAEEYVWLPVDEALRLPVEPYTKRAIRAYLEQQSAR